VGKDPDYCCQRDHLIVTFSVIGAYVRKEFERIKPEKGACSFLHYPKGFCEHFHYLYFQFALNSNAKSQEIILQNQMLKRNNPGHKYESIAATGSPSFLFNSLSTLRSMIRSGNKNAETFIVKLSEIYRQLLLKREKEFIPLKEELEFVNDYSFMLFARFEDRITIDTDIPENLMDLKVPTFSLQILLENCIKHNIVSQEKPLKIKIFNTGTDGLIIENNYQPKLSQQEPSGYGLQNLAQRYTLLGFPDSVDVFSDESVFRVRIKLLDL